MLSSMTRAVGRVSRGETAGTQCRGFTRSGIRHWGGFADNISCVATGFASFPPAVRRARLNYRVQLPGTVAPARSRLSGLLTGKRSARSLAARCQSNLVTQSVGGQFRAVAARRGYGVKAARSHDPQARVKRTNHFPFESRSDEVPRRHLRARKPLNVVAAWIGTETFEQGAA